MMSERENGKMGKAAKWVKDNGLALAREMVGRHDDDMSNEGASRQFRRDMERATAAFAELGADKQQMHELLRKWFGVDSMEEADSYIKEGAQFEYPMTLLEEYLKREGCETMDIIRFKKDHNVVEKLRRDPSLSNLTAEQLKQRMEQNE
ncbi:hypothetical protein [Bifidobacterium scardovii]|nr:hypothetical protein [Bifidobacterium scardovii]MDK6350016.1 hypothetical protein [Bifidobacterium scardovii]MDU8982137.1 hypothetical protein [Bifidobacterium scardovii]BAQ30468.1 hypothetical protein BBSC_0388 [Bifidobacterium scardovii JCM 12489 = DSM 13734]